MVTPQRKSAWVAVSLIVLIAGMLIWSSGEPEKPGATGSLQSPSPLPSKQSGNASSEPTASSPSVNEVTPSLATGEGAALAVPSTAPTTALEPRATTPLTATAPVAGLDLTAELDQVQLALRDFRTVHGENPVGTNAEITQALMGDNLKQLKLSVPTGSQLNAAGELSDRWGTPYFFHQVSKTEMEVRSAGPDRTMWTNDDRQM